MMKRLFLSILIAIGVLSGVPVACAELVVYEGFDYTAGQGLLGQNGGTGFPGSWFDANNPASDSDKYSVASGSFTYPGLPFSGGRVVGDSSTSNAWIRRSLPASRDTPIGTNGTTIWLSMLYRPTQTSLIGQGYSVLSLVQPSKFGEVPEELTIGMDGSGTFGIGQLGGVGRVASNTLPTLNQTSLLVMKAEFNASSGLNDTFTLFVDPDLSAGEPMFGVSKTDFNIGTFSEIAIRSTRDFEIDEIRIGTTFGSLAPVPEPTSLLLFATSVGLVSTRRRRDS